MKQHSSSKSTTEGSAAQASSVTVVPPPPPPPLPRTSEVSVVADDDDCDEEWEPQQDSAANLIASSDTEIDVRSHRSSRVSSPRANDGVGNHAAAEEEQLFAQAEATRVSSTVVRRVDPTQRRGEEEMEVDRRTDESAQPISFDHEPFHENIDDDDEDDEYDRSPYTPYVPVTPLSIGRGDRYSLLNVHDPAADLAARTYSQLSRRGAASVTSFGGGGLLRVSTTNNNALPAPVPVVPASPVLALPSHQSQQQPATPHQKQLNYFQRLRFTLAQRKENPYPIAIGWDLFPTFILSFTAMMLLAICDIYLARQHLPAGMTAFLPSFGASAAILFGLPKSPFAQPRNFFFGHLTGAIAGVSTAQWIRPAIEQQPISDLTGGTIAVSLTMGTMMYFNLMHPSACATAVSAAAVTFLNDPNDRGYLFVLIPVLLACIILFMVAWLGNNLFAARAPYPMYW
ncbi:transmembrane protein, putative [Bodo saltans]|uniref:Transmembrane protein, putative n=1 Tax=Bodo saltans TaxID=75058 RepID=A0A0S4IRS1_BODSA|nr:transmembrane protein, putative [Bodo saltans]|eukprot:CUF43082.1 transmembrane protein, putative [Bodo saltans]